MTPQLRLGEPIIYIPVLQSAAGYDGRPMPLGYVRVEKVVECPICVEQNNERTDHEPR